MIPLYKNNYLRTHGHGENFAVEIDPLPASFDNLYVESCKAAEELYDLKQGKFYILYSGGIDSEYCLSVFLSLGMDVTPVIIKLNPSYNAHDIEYAFKFCESKNIKPLIIEIDFLDFIESGKMVDICHEIKSSTFGRAPVAYATGLLDGTVILGDGQPYVKLNEKDGIWYMVEEEHDFSVYNYFKLHGIHGTPHFNRFTPGMFAAHMTDPRMLELANNLHTGKLSNNSSRHVVYNRHSGFDLQPRNKYHGFEYLKTFDEIRKHAEIFVELQKFGFQYDGEYSISYHNFINNYIR